MLEGETPSAARPDRLPGDPGPARSTRTTQEAVAHEYRDAVPARRRSRWGSGPAPACTGIFELGAQLAARRGPRPTPRRPSRGRAEPARRPVQARRQVVPAGLGARRRCTSPTPPASPMAKIRSSSRRRGMPAARDVFERRRPVVQARPAVPPGRQEPRARAVRLPLRRPARAGRGLPQAAQGRRARTGSPGSATGTRTARTAMYDWPLERPGGQVHHAARQRPDRQVRGGRRLPDRARPGLAGSLGESTDPVAQFKVSQGDGRRGQALRLGLAADVPERHPQPRDRTASRTKPLVAINYYLPPSRPQDQRPVRPDRGARDARRALYYRVFGRGEEGKAEAPVGRARSPRGRRSSPSAATRTSR